MKDKKKSLYEQENMEDVFYKTAENVEKSFKVTNKINSFLAPMAMSTMIAASSVFLVEKGFEVKRAFKAKSWIEANCPNMKRLIYRKPLEMIGEAITEFKRPKPSIGNIPAFNQYIQSLNDPLICYYIAGFSAEYFISDIEDT